MDALRLMELGEEYVVEREINEYTNEIKYFIESRNSMVACRIDSEKNIDYYVTDVDNSVSQYAKIEMDALMELKEFAELIIKFNDRGE